MIPKNDLKNINQKEKLSLVRPLEWMEVFHFVISPTNVDSLIRERIIIISICKFNSVNTNKFMIYKAMINKYWIITIIAL